MDKNNGALDPTPTTDGGMMGPQPVWRMDAYYYGFDMTGIAIIDRILSAVACAGKSFHHTQDWNDEVSPYGEHLRGNSPVEWIQNAANDAAELLRAREQ